MLLGPWTMLFYGLCFPLLASADSMFYKYAKVFNDKQFYTPSQSNHPPSNHNISTFTDENDNHPSFLPQNWWISSQLSKIRSYMSGSSHKSSKAPQRKRKIDYQSPDDPSWYGCSVECFFEFCFEFVDCSYNCRSLVFDNYAPSRCRINDACICVSER